MYAISLWQVEFPGNQDKRDISTQDIYYTQGEGESRPGQREKLVCSAVSTEVSAQSTRSSAAGVVLQSGLKMWGEWKAFVTCMLSSY